MPTFPCDRSRLLAGEARRVNDHQTIPGEFRRKTSVLLISSFCICVCLSTPYLAHAQRKPVVIAASTMLDGRGHVLHDTRILVQNGKIMKIDSKAEPVAYDLDRKSTR